MHDGTIESLIYIKRTRGEKEGIRFPTKDLLVLFDLIQHNFYLLATAASAFFFPLNNFIFRRKSIRNSANCISVIFATIGL